MGTAGRRIPATPCRDSTLVLTSIFLDGPPTESVDRFAFGGWCRAGRQPEYRVRCGLPDGSYLFPWIEEVEDFLSDLEDQGDADVFDEGEGDVYVFFISGAGGGIFWRWSPAWPPFLASLWDPSRSSVTTRLRSSVWGDVPLPLPAL